MNHNCWANKNIHHQKKKLFDGICPPVNTPQNIETYMQCIGTNVHKKWNNALNHNHKRERVPEKILMIKILHISQ